DVRTRCLPVPLPSTLLHTGESQCHTSDPSSAFWPRLSTDPYRTTEADLGTPTCAELSADGGISDVRRLWMPKGCAVTPTRSTRPLALASPPEALSLVL